MTGMTQVTERPAATPMGGRDPAILVTGASGEVGHGLIAALRAAGRERIVALDVRELDDPQRALCRSSYVGDIRDGDLVRDVIREHEIDEVYHLAAILSSTAEENLALAHEVNVNGTVNVLVAAAERAGLTGRDVRMLFPSSVAVYALPDAETKRKAGAICEDEYADPLTMYGCNKRYIEHLGRYFAERWGVDFRALRYPGLISAETLPSGGTSDFAPEMVHAAAAGKPVCVLRAAGHPHPVHDDARRDRRDAPARGGRARSPHAPRLQHHRIQPVGGGARRAPAHARRRSAGHVRARSRPPGDRGQLARGSRRRRGAS